MVKMTFCADGCGTRIPKPEPSTSTTEPKAICDGCWNYRMEQARKARVAATEGAG